MLNCFTLPFFHISLSSGVFILLVDVTALRVKLSYGKFSWMGMIWKGIHVLIKGLTAENAYQSKGQALGSKEQSVELRDRIASNHASGEELRKKICRIEVSQKHAVSITLNGRSLEQPGLLELAKLSNWWRRALVRVVTKKPMVTLVELQDHMLR